MSIDPRAFDGAVRALGMSSAELAKLLGCTKRAVNKWRSGESKCPVTVALVVCALLEKKITVIWIQTILEDAKL